VVRVPDGRAYRLIEFLGEQMSAVVVNMFKPLRPADHQPRVTVDRLVMQRESWHFAAADTAWALAKQEIDRFRLAQLWRVEHGIPPRAFYRVPSELKPIYVDFTSISLVERLAKAVKLTASAGPDEESGFTISEMLPDIHETWLPDTHGRRYAAELRLVMVDPDAPGPD